VATHEPSDTPRDSDPTMHADAPHGRGNLTGHVAIVTGGGRGIGRAIAQALARAGAAVAVAARSEAQLADTVRLITQSGGRALPVVTDVVHPQAVARLVETTEQQFGPVDLLVNNAGVAGPIGPLWEVEPDTWWGGVEVHLRGTFLCTRAVLARLCALCMPIRVLCLALLTSTRTSSRSGCYTYAVHFLGGVPAHAWAATGGNAGCSQRTCEAFGVSLPIGSQYV
jgi:NAD(P)-dependent dehydrogenase (short-subunit alcohol dehydrogenase family)